MTETLIERTQRHEGFTAIPKPDAKGKYVIGYGHDIDQEEVIQYIDGITEIYGLQLLISDLDLASEEVANTFSWTRGMDPLRLEVLEEMCFQLGLAGLLEFHRALQACEQKDYTTAADEMLNSVWHRQTPTRCEELAEIMRTNTAR